MSIFRLFGLVVFIAQKDVYSFQNIIKDVFLAYIAQKKKGGKMAIFGPKPWVNPFGKMSIFRLFGLLVFIAQKDVFSFQNIIKNIFVAYIAQKKKLGKMAIFGPKPWVNMILKNVNFSPFWTCCFYSLERRLLVLEYHKRRFPGLYCLEKKRWKNGHFWTKTMG